MMTPEQQDSVVQELLTDPEWQAAMNEDLSGMKPMTLDEILAYIGSLGGQK